MGNGEPTADFDVRERFWLWDKQVYKAFIKSIVLFLWPTHLWNVKIILCIYRWCDMWKYVFPHSKCSSYSPIFLWSCSPLFNPSGKLSKQIVPDCTSPICFINSMFPSCPMPFDMHISWSHKWTLLIQNKAAPPPIRCLCSVTLRSDSLWDHCFDIFSN